MTDATFAALLEADGRTRAEVERGFGDLSIMLREQGVDDGPELQRVLKLPRRGEGLSYTIDELIDAWSAALRLREFDDEGRPVRLRAPQAEALRELWEQRGLFAPMRVGSGKTLVTLLAATVLCALRPVLLVPANLREKTKRDFARYRRDWNVRLPHIISYQALGQPRGEFLLAGSTDKTKPSANPDLLLLDEAHCARNLDASVTRRIRRCIETLRPTVACLSGTLMTANLTDYHHHAVWALGERAPVPLQRADAERWGQALDRDVGTLKRLAKGALEQIPGGFHAWFRGSKGVVPTPGQDCDAAIQLSVWSPPLPPERAAMVDEIGRSGLRPDGELLDEFDIPEVQCQVALDFYYVWDPLPPSWWMLPRRAYMAYVRAVLDEQLEGFDSPAMIGSALANPSWPRQPPAADEGRRLRDAWLAVKPRFKPNTVPVWLESSPLATLAAAVEHTRDRGYVIWSPFTAVGTAMQHLGVPYYGGGGRRGDDPENAPDGPTICCSFAAHGVGKNLQARSRMLFLRPPANPDAWEQGIGRQHRAGQRADVVGVEVIGTIPYHGEVMGRVYTEAKAVTRASGFSHKLVDADWL